MKNNRRFAKAVIFIILIYMLLPLCTTFIYSISTAWSNTLLPEGITLKWFSEMFSDPRFISAIGRTVFVSIISVICSLIIILITMFTLLHYAPWARAFVKYLSVLPFMLPAVILAIGLTQTYSSIIPSIGGRVFMLIGAYCILILPYIYQGINNGMSNINAQELTAAAEMLGASKMTAFCKVIFPNILSGVVSAVLLSLSILFGEFVLSNLMLGSQFETIQVYLYMRLKESGHFASAVTVTYFIVEMLLSGSVIKISNSMFRRKKHELYRNKSIEQNLS